MATETQDKAVSGELIPGGQSTILSRMGEARIELARMIEAVPEAGGDGEINIIEAIMAATSADELDQAWNANGLERYLGQKLTVTGLRRSPSDFVDGLGIFLLINVADEAGQQHVITCGSVSVVAQLLKAHSLGALPRTFIPRRAERASANGYFPLHLEVAR